MNSLLLNQNNSYLFDYRILICDLIKQYLKKKIKTKNEIVCLKTMGNINLSSFLINEKLINYKNKNSDVYRYIIPLYSKLKPYIIIKIIPLSYNDIKYMYDTSIPIWRELQILKLLSVYSLKRVLPTLPIIYNYYICNSCKFKNIHLQKYNKNLCLIILSEYNNYDLKNWLIDLSKKKLSTQYLTNIWNNLIFQILITLYFLYKKYKLLHSDLHWNNILIQTHIKNGYWIYKIDGLSYYLPNLGFTVKLWDFGNSHSNSFFNKKKDKSLSDNKNELTDLYRFSNIYNWIRKEDKIKNNIIPVNIIDLLNKFKNQNNNSLKNIITKNMYMYLHNKIGTKAPDYIIKNSEKVLYSDNFYRGEIILYNNKYAIIHDIYKFNIYIITNINNSKNYIFINFNKIYKIKDNVSLITNKKYNFLLEKNIGIYNI